MEAATVEPRRARRQSKEVHTSDMGVGQQPTVDLDARLENPEPETIEPVQGFLSKNYAEDLAFNEQPVKIRLEPSSEKFAPRVADGWVNGVGIEVLMNGKWVALGYIPVGQVVVTKRKYVEVLARAKHDSVTTQVVETPGEDPRNYAHRFTSVKYPFSVIEDRSPNGSDWLQRLIAEG
jgi:hypothetical protein